MSYAIYSTSGFILGSQPTGEASKTYLIYTEHFGLVRARAQGARLLSGKLRYSLEPMTHGMFSFVDGRYGMRLVGTESFGVLLSSDRRSRASIGNIVRLLTRLLPADEAHPKLCALVRDGFVFMNTCAHENLMHAECALVLSILRELGYLPDDPQLMRYAQEPLSHPLLVEFGSIKSHAIRTINQVLSESGL